MMIGVTYGEANQNSEENSANGKARNVSGTANGPERSRKRSRRISKVVRLTSFSKYGLRESISLRRHDREVGMEDRR